MLKALFAVAFVVSLLCVGAQAANNCDELTGTISGSMVFENCSIPSGTLAIGPDSDIKFFNLSTTEANVNVASLNVIIHIFGGVLTAMGGNIFVVNSSSQVRNVTLHVKDVTAHGTSSSAFSVRANNVQGVTITFEDCDIDVGTSGSGDRRGIGAILPSSMTFTIEDVTLTALRSVLVVRGNHAVAAMGVAVLDRSSGHGTITSLLAHVVDSDVQVLGKFIASSIGISVAGDWGAMVVTLTPTNVTMAVYGSSVVTGGSSNVASLGIAVGGASSATVSPTNVTMAAHGSNVMVSGDAIAASLGILSSCLESGCHTTLTARDILITAQLSHITATGPNAGIVVMGFGSFGEQSDSIPATTITNATAIARSSTIVSSEVAFDVVGRFDRSGSPERFQHQQPVSVANWSVAIIDSPITTEYTGWTGNCLMALPNATHNGTAPSIICDSVLNCSGLPTTEPMAADMLFASKVKDHTGNEVTFIGANTTDGPFAESGCSATRSASLTLTVPPTRSPTRSASLTLTVPPTRSATRSASLTLTVSPTRSPTRSASLTLTVPPTRSPTRSASLTMSPLIPNSLATESNTQPSVEPNQSTSDEAPTNASDEMGVSPTPAPTALSPIVEVVGLLVFGGDFAAMLEPSSKGALSTALQADLARFLGVATELVNIVSMRFDGNLTVNYTVKSPVSEVTELRVQIGKLSSTDTIDSIPRVALLYEALHGTNERLQILLSVAPTDQPHTESIAPTDGDDTGVPTWVVITLLCGGVMLSFGTIAVRRKWRRRAASCIV